MKYDNSNVRRQDRLLDEGKATQLLKSGEFGTLSMVTPEGAAYGIPVSFVWDGRESIYVHCAPEGRKLRCIGHQPAVSFSIVGGTHVIPGKFTTRYSSVVVTCKAETGLCAEERMEALRLLIGKYAPDFQETGEKYAQGSFHRTEIIKLSIEYVSGKEKEVSE